ncbi:MAG TPA: patatin-like phospholipase family protein [Thermoanaerobaculia bacterium]|nr:patatin-like phospholipase family protein [Thermoanaerobaculia bacterium]
MSDWDKLANDYPEYRLLAQKFREPRPRRLLALDGGGIRGVLTLEVLAELERQLREKTGGGPDFRLSDYFDYVAGTSTGAIIAAGLALGFPVQKLLDFYQKSGKAMFKKPWLWKRLWYSYESKPLLRTLKRTFSVDGQDTTLGSGNLRCLLLVVLRNVTTDSPWPLSSNPFATYNRLERKDSNLRVPLYKLVRASTAAPVFFSPQTISFEEGNAKKTFKFEDGGMTPYNNPAFLLYRMATEEPYKLSWEKGEKKLLLVSVGTGAAPLLDARIYSQGNSILKNAANIPSALMYGAQIDQDVNCRLSGRCVYGAPIDREIGDLIPLDRSSTLDSPPHLPLSVDLGRNFLYARYNVELTHEGLADLGITGVDPEKVAKLDSVKSMKDLRRIGKALGEKTVDVTRFGPHV